MLVAVMRLFRHPLFDTDMIRRVGGAPTVIPSLMHYTTALVWVLRTLRRRG